MRPIRSLDDWLIAAIARRTGISVAHRDGGFVRIDDATGLQTIDLRG